jgi:glycosyltransferase
MKISIITPVYNDLRVGRALDSILSQQQDAELELVVIDGGSTDGTLDVLSRYDQYMSVLVSEPDGGIYDAMNKGIARATGDVIGILNADDQYPDSRVLRDVMAVFQESETTDACYGDLLYVNDSGRPTRYWKSGAYRPSRFYLGWMPPHPTFFVRKRVYERYGAFDTRYTIAADYELMLRLILKCGISVSYLDRVLVRMTAGGKSNRSLGNIVRANLEALRSWRDNGLPFGYLVPILKPAQKITQYLHRPPLLDTGTDLL